MNKHSRLHPHSEPKEQLDRLFEESATAHHFPMSFSGAGKGDLGFVYLVGSAGKIRSCQKKINIPVVSGSHRPVDEFFFLRSSNRNFLVYRMEHLKVI